MRRRTACIHRVESLGPVPRLSSSLQIQFAELLGTRNVSGAHRSLIGGKRQSISQDAVGFLSGRCAQGDLQMLGLKGGARSRDAGADWRGAGN